MKYVPNTSEEKEDEQQQTEGQLGTKSQQKNQRNTKKFNDVSSVNGMDLWEILINLYFEVVLFRLEFVDWIFVFVLLYLYDVVLGVCVQFLIEAFEFVLGV